MNDPIDDARALHQHAADMRDVQQRLGDVLSDAEQTLIVLQRFIPAETWSKLCNRVTRLKEMRNGMEMASFSFQLDKGAEQAAREIMNPTLPPARMPKPRVRKRLIPRSKSLIQSLTEGY